MIEVAEDRVIFSRETWEELKSDVYYKEFIDAIIEREDFLLTENDYEYSDDSSEIDWQKPGRPATEEELEKLSVLMINDDGDYTVDEVRLLVHNRIEVWNKSKLM